MLTQKQKYNLFLLFIGALCLQGKRTKAELLYIQVIFRLKQEYNDNPFNIFIKILDITTPLVKLRSKRIGGVVYQLPSNIDSYSQYIITIHWLIKAINKRHEKTIEQRLFSELKAIINGFCFCIQKQKNVYNTAIANYPFL